MNWTERLMTTTVNGRYCRLEPLTVGHLTDLEDQFDPALFDFYPKLDLPGFRRAVPYAA